MSANGNTNVLTPSKDQDAIRRAKKKNRRKTPNGGPMGTGGTYTAGLAADRETARTEQAAARQAQKDKLAAKQLAFWQTQAKEALKLLDPTLDVFILKVASLVIDLFPTVTPSDGLKRTRTAEEEMRKRLDVEELRRSKDITKGIVAARVALSLAFEQHPDKKR